MNKKLRDGVGDYLQLGSHLLFHHKNFIIFGKEQNDDIFIKGKLSFSCPTHLYQDLKIVNIADASLEKLFFSVEKLVNSSAFAIFQLTDVDIKKIKKTISEIDATHIRIHNHNGKLRCSLFDIRKFSDETRLSRKRTNSLRYIEIDCRLVNDFTFTIFSESFKKLPNSDFQIRVGQNSICEFELIKEDVQYYFRDQGLVEPITVFHSELVGQDIAFVFHPNSSHEDEDTSQNLHSEVASQGF